MDTQNFPQPVQDEFINTQRAFWVAVILSLFALGSLGLLIYLSFVTPVWQVYAVTAITAIAAGVDVAGAVMIRRGRAELGLKMLYWSTMFSIAPNALFTAGAGPILVFSILWIGYINVFYLQPRSWRKRYQYGPLLISLLITAIEFWNPPFRFTFFSTPFFGPFALVFLVGGVIFLMLYQARETIASSLRLKILVWMTTIVVILAVVLVSYSVITARQSSIEAAQLQALSIAETQAGIVKSQIVPAMDAARSLAYSFGAAKDKDHPIELTRDQVNGILRKLAQENPSFLGTWTLWEPNSFDGLDEQYANTPLHDQTGRFIPYWVWVSDTVEGVAIVDYETPGLNDYYAIPRETRQETILTPYFYPIEGVDVMMTSVAVPIVENNRFYGAAGVDLPIGFVQGLVDGINLYDGEASALLFTEDGTVIAARNQPELALQSATSLFDDFDQIQPRIANGETFASQSPDGKYLRVFAPVITDKAGSRWWFGLVIPFSAIAEAATVAAVREAVISIILLAMAIAVLWLFTGQVVRPINDLTAAAAALARGELNIVARVQTSDETSILANTFNAMTSRLRETLSTLEERVAERTRNLELAAEVGRSISQVRALNVMLTEAAELVREQFDLYYVQVYLSNPSQTQLVLQAGTGSVGTELIGRSHSLPLDAVSINGRAATEKRVVVISDTASSASFRPNPLLPETRSEMAVPLMVGQNVVGVLDMQSEHAGALNEEALPAFEALAGQLAVAIQNARLLAETEQARAEVEKQTARLTRENWKEYLDAIHKPEMLGFQFEKNQVLPLEKAQAGSATENALSAPISVAGEALGSLIVEMESEDQNPKDAELVNIVARQVAQQIENLRLLESAERYRREAEEASRRLTREGWQSYNEGLGRASKYFYDLNEVRPLDGEPPMNAAKLPVKVRDTVMGQVAIQGLDENDQESLELVSTVAERLGAHIESLRQFGETQSALAQSEKLFEASRRLTQTADLQELTTAAVEAINIPVINRAIMTIFDYGAGGNVEGLDVTANWWNGTGIQATAIGTHYTADVVRMIPMFVSPTPLFFDDAFSDERVDPATMRLVKQLNLRTVAVLPLHAGAKQIGVLMLEGEEPHNFTQDEKRLFVALGPQIATVMENRRQFERAQRQAERESMLNAINQKIQNATTVEAVLQIAARELGHALGAPMTIAKLNKNRS